MLLIKWLLLILNVIFFFTNFTSPLVILHILAIIVMTVSIAAHDDMTNNK